MRAAETRGIPIAWPTCSGDGTSISTCVSVANALPCGVIHNSLRMVWGKKIIEWSETPEEAHRTMVRLHDVYALDEESGAGMRAFINDQKMAKDTAEVLLYQLEKLDIDTIDFAALRAIVEKARQRVGSAAS